MLVANNSIVAVTRTQCQLVSDTGGGMKGYSVQLLQSTTFV